MKPSVPLPKAAYVQTVRARQPGGDAQVQPERSTQAEDRQTRAMKAATQLVQASKRRLQAVEHLKNPILALGGCEKACTLMAIAMLDTDGDGVISPADGDEVLEVGRRLVSSNKDFQLNAGLVGALVLSVLYPLAYEENDALANLVAKEHWATQEWSDLTSLLAMQTAITTSMLTVLVSSRLYTQLAFWMPTLEAQLWYIDASSSSLLFLEVSKNMMLFTAILVLVLETMTVATWLNVVALLPLSALIVPYVYVECRLGWRCADRLREDLRGMLSAASCSRHTASTGLLEPAV